jgi:hypothetical protein
MGHEASGTVSQWCHKYFNIDIFVKTPRIIFKVLNFECIISKSIAFYFFFFYSRPSELNEIISFAKKLFLIFSLEK